MGWVSLGSTVVRLNSLTMSVTCLVWGMTSKASTCCGGVIIDAMGTWLMDFSRKLGNTGVLAAEFYGIYSGLYLAQSKRCRKIWLEADSSSTVKLCKDKPQRSHPLLSNCENTKDHRKWLGSAISHTHWREIMLRISLSTMVRKSN